MLNCLIVGAGGFVGAVLRYLMSLAPLGRGGAFPVNTLVINVLGAFAIGLAAAAASRLDPRAALFIRVGICGGFTTFSSFALETTTLMQNGHTAAAAAYVALSVCLCVGAVFAASASLRLF